MSWAAAHSGVGDSQIVPDVRQRRMSRAQSGFPDSSRALELRNGFVLAGFLEVQHRQAVIRAGDFRPHRRSVAADDASASSYIWRASTLLPRRRQTFPRLRSVATRDI